MVIRMHKITDHDDLNRSELIAMRDPERKRERETDSEREREGERDRERQRP